MFHLYAQIANIGPADYNSDETLNTLRYADRAKHIQNRVRINEDPKDAMLREFQKEIDKLKKMLSENSEEGESGEESEESEDGKKVKRKKSRKGKNSISCK